MPAIPEHFLAAGRAISIADEADPVCASTCDEQAQLRQLNREFLNLIVDPAGHMPFGLRQPGVQALASVTATALDALAACPYALFALPDCFGGARGDAPPGVVRFANAAWFYAWHLARQAPSCLPLWLGVDPERARRLQRLSVCQVSARAFALAAGIAARGAQQSRLWEEMARCAQCGDHQRLRFAQLWLWQVSLAH